MDRYDDYQDYERGMFRSVLLSGERILWSGCPAPKTILGKRDLFMIPFSLMWGGFAIFWEATVILSDAPLMFKIWGIPFVLVGLYMIFGRFITDKYVMKHTYYAVTNMRVIRCICNKIDARSIDHIPVEISYEKEDTGTISFDGSQFPKYYREMSTISKYSKNVFEFVSIPDVQKVYSLILKAQKEMYRDGPA